MIAITDDDNKGKRPTLRGVVSDSVELQDMLYAISEYFPLVIWVNLTRNTFKMLEYERYATQQAPVSGTFDDCVDIGASTMAPEHRQAFYDAFSRENLLKAYARGEKKVVLESRQLRDDGSGYMWVRTTVIFLTNHEDDEVLEVTLSRPIDDEKAKELDNLRLRTVLEMALLANYEYVYMINTRTGRYELYASDGKEKGIFQLPPKGDYEKALIFIRDMMVPEMERAEFCKNARLSTVTAMMQETGGHYHYRFRFCDTPERRWREVVYRYYLPDQDELLMMMRDVHDEVMSEQAKRAEEALRRDREIQQILTGLGFDVIIDIDLATSRAELLGVTGSFLQRDIICERFPLGEIEAGMVHPEDADTLARAMDFTGKESICSADFRYKRGNGVFFWCRLRAVLLQDGTGKPYRCICKLTDIDEQKRNEQKLIQKAQSDSLTGLYNNMTTEMLIDDYLSGDGANACHGLMVVDVDDFKQVNDNWGHKTGDILLKAVADIFKGSFRSSDIIGRVGGDEFVVFLKDVKSGSDVIESANALRERISAIRLAAAGAGYTPVCSIGIGLYPDHGRTYSDVFRVADAALYYIKEHGKNGVRLYDLSIDILKHDNPVTIPSA